MQKRFGSAVVLFLSVFLLLAPINLEAAETGPFYAGVFGGYSFGSDAEWTFVPFAAFSLDIQETWVGGVKFGYTPPSAKYLAVELEYFYMNPDIDRTALVSGVNSVSVDGDATAHTFMLNILAKYPEGKIHPYVGIGMGFSYVDVSATGTAVIGGRTLTQPLNGSDTSFAFQFLAGVNFEINKNWSADLAYRWFTTNPSMDSGDIEFTTNFVTIGVNYHF